jgi:hypothetical protein
MSGDPVRGGEVSLSILLQSWLSLLNHILWKIKLYAMSNLVKLYTIQFIAISNGTYFQMISKGNYHRILLNKFLQFKFKLLSANSV